MQIIFFEATSVIDKLGTSARCKSSGLGISNATCRWYWDLLGMMVHASGWYILTLAKGPAPLKNTWVAVLPKAADVFSLEKHCHSGCATALSFSCVSSQLVGVQPISGRLRFFWCCACMSQAPLLFVQLPLQPFLASEAWMKHPMLARTKTFSTGHIGLWKSMKLFVLSTCPTIMQMIRHAQGAFVVPLQLLGSILQQNYKLPSLLLRLPLRKPSFSYSSPWMVPCSIFRCRDV